MTGTPTQQITNQNGLRNLYYMINFLKHGFFNRRLGREQCWNDLISSGWQTGNIGAFFRLRNLLSYLMVRHTKADLVEIPPPIYTTTRINPSPSEIITVSATFRARVNARMQPRFLTNILLHFVYSTTPSFRVSGQILSQQLWKERLQDGKTVYFTPDKLNMRCGH